MLGRLLQVIQWISLAGLVWGCLIFYDKAIYKGYPMYKIDMQIIALFLGQYFAYVVVLWIINKRWIWLPWQYNND